MWFYLLILIVFEIKTEKNLKPRKHDSHSIRNWSNIIISHSPWKTSLVRKWRVKGQITSQFYYESSFDLLDPQQSISHALRTKALLKLQDSPNYKINKIGPLGYYRGCPEEANANLLQRALLIHPHKIPTGKKHAMSNTSPPTI